MITYKNKNRKSVNFLKTIYFDYPEWTHCEMVLMPATWMKYREDLEKVVLAHPRIFPGYSKGSTDFDFKGLLNPLYELGERIDAWGTVWKNVERGLDSFPIIFPLEEWENQNNYTYPDPLKDDIFGPRDWDLAKQKLSDEKKRGDLAIGDGLPHGFMYMRLFYLRRFENLMMDMAVDDPRLQSLLKMVEEYNRVVISKYLALGTEIFSLADDLGLQNALPMGPDLWRKFIKPAYDRLLRPCREANLPIRLHTDGHILEIIPDLAEVGVRLLNPQFRSNGLEGLVEIAKGKVALHLDLDRQLLPYATPSEIENHIGEIFEALYMPEGGLMIYAECEPDVPLENIDTLCTTLEKICRLPVLSETSGDRTLFYMADNRHTD